MAKAKPLDYFIDLMQRGAFQTKGKAKTAMYDGPAFVASMRTSRHPEALTFYEPAEYAEKGARLYKLPGIDAGFAVSGNGDIISVHNNSNVRGLGPHMIAAAKARGGNHLDHFDIPRLNEVYGGQGLQRFGHMEWNDEYAPDNWNYEANGRPDVILRGTPSYIKKYCSDPAHYDDCNDLDQVAPKVYRSVMDRRKGR